MKHKRTEVETEGQARVWLHNGNGLDFRFIKGIDLVIHDQGPDEPDDVVNVLEFAWADIHISANGRMRIDVVEPRWCLKAASELTPLVSPQEVEELFQANEYVNGEA